MGAAVILESHRCHTRGTVLRPCRHVGHVVEAVQHGDAARAQGLNSTTFAPQLEHRGDVRWVRRMVSRDEIARVEVKTRKGNERRPFHLYLSSFKV